MNLKYYNSYEGRWIKYSIIFAIGIFIGTANGLIGYT